MKRILILLALLGTTVTLTAQTWCPNGATWHFSFMQMLSYGYVKINYTSDTTILSKDCKTLLKVQYGYSYPGVYDTVQLGKEYTYLDSASNIVYRFFDGKFDTLYNFNAQIGDVWKVHGMHGSIDSGIVVVDSIGYEVINADTLKSLFVSTISGSCIGWNSTKIIEKIGCINEYMFPNYVSCIADLSEGGGLRCYSDDNFSQYSTGEAIFCDFLTSVNPIDKNPEQIKVLPNPSNGSFTIDIDQQFKIKEIIVSTMLGNIILRQQTDNQTRIKIDNLKGGTYILTAIDKDNRTINKTIISLP